MAGDWIPMQLNLDKIREVQNIVDAIESQLLLQAGQRLNVGGTLSQANPDNLQNQVDTVLKNLGQHRQLEEQLAAQRVKIKRYVVGCLHAFWSFFDQNSTDGRIENVSIRAIDSEIGHDGFCQLLIDQGWLEKDGKCLVMPNFDAFNGESFKQRVKDSRRKRDQRNGAQKSRENISGTLSQNSRDTVPKKTGPTGQDRTGQKRTTKEEIQRRGEVSPNPSSLVVFPKGDSSRKTSSAEPHPPSPPPADPPPKPPKTPKPSFDPKSISLPEELATEPFLAVWDTWIRHRKEIRKPLTQAATEAQLKSFVDWGAERSITALEYTIANGWQGVREPERPRGSQKPSEPRMSGQQAVQQILKEMGID